MLVSYFGELSTELRPVFPAVLLRLSKLNMIRIDELYWKTPQGYQIFIYRSSGNHCPCSSWVLSHKWCFRDSFVYAIPFESWFGLFFLIRSHHFWKLLRIYFCHSSLESFFFSTNLLLVPNRGLICIYEVCAYMY